MTSEAPRAVTPTPPSGPRGIAALRSLERLRVDFLAELGRLHDAYGDVCLISGAGQRYLVLFHPDDVERVHVGAAASVRKGFAIRRARRLLGNGIITSEGEFHGSQRRIVHPCLQRRRVAGYAADMVAETDRVVDDFPAAGGEVDLERAMGNIGLGIIGRTMLGVDLRGDAAVVYRALDVARGQFAATLAPLAPVTSLLPLPGPLAFRSARRTLRRVVGEAIDSRQRAGTADDDPDLLDLLLASRDDAGRPMPRRQVVDEALTMVLAGHETVANTLAWTLHLLGRHPELRERLVDEVDSVLGGATPTAEDAERLPWVRAAFLETLRLYPQCYSMTRTALEPIDCPHVRIERGWEIIVPQWTIHRDPRWWPDPERFDPTRFLDAAPGRATGDRPKYAYFPFSGGRRACIGQPFSMLEGVMVLARLLQRVELAPVAASPQPSPHAVFTLWPGSFRMHATPRASAATA
ncbi:MAG: cytochrome [Thermoleophilia bacterium]|nr:cytochrome [Thermoleophilia bacterium]